MKFADNVATIEGNAVFEDTKRASVDNESLPHIIRSLTDMYSNPLLAVAREYISNAYDATVERMGVESSFGTVLDIPIEVTLPSQLQPEFVIRDYGTGMDREILSNVFLQYGASTKRDTNNQIGGFGLGAKSALAIVQNFTVVSVKDGKKNVGIIQKGEDGVGEISFLPEVETDAPSGTVVKITLSAKDASTLFGLFNTERSILLLGFPHGSIKINGKMHENSVFNTSLYTKLGEYGYVKNHLWNGTELFASNPETPMMDRSRTDLLTVLVGPIAYTLRRYDLPDNLRKGLQNFLDRPAMEHTVLSLPIGSVDMTPARETLIFSERTCKAIIESAQKMLDDMTSRVQTEMDNCASKKEAVNFSTKAHREWLRDEEPIFWKGFPESPVPSRIWSYFALPYTGMNSSTGTWHAFQSVVRLYQGHDNSFILDNQKVVLVTGLKNTPKASTTTIIGRVKRYAPFFTKERLGVEECGAIRSSKGEPKAVIVYTSADASHYDSWLAEIADVVVPVEDFIEVGRKRQQEETKQKKKAKSDIPAVAVVGLNSKGKAVVSAKSIPAASLLSGLHQNDDVIFFANDPKNPKSLGSQLAASLQNVKNTSISRDEIGAFINRIRRNQAPAKDKGYVFVRLTATTNLDEFLKIVPNAVPIDGLLQKEVAKLVETTSPTRALYLKHRTEYKWLAERVLTNEEESTTYLEQLDNIVNPEARAFFKSLSENAQKVEGQTDEYNGEKEILASSLFTNEFGQMRREVELLHAKFQLPLASYLASSGEEMMKDLVDYINTLYPAEG